MKEVIHEMYSKEQIDQMVTEIATRTRQKKLWLFLMRLRKIKVLIQHIKNRLRRTDRLRQRCRQQRRQQHHRVDMQKLRHMTK